MRITLKRVFTDGARVLALSLHFFTLFIWRCPFVWFKIPPADTERFFDLRFLWFHFRVRKATKGSCPLCFCREDGHWHYSINGFSSFWVSRRWLIFLRYKALCFYCGGICPFEEGEVDHIIPRRIGGSDKLDNLRWVHPVCHDKFHLEEYRLARLGKNSFEN